MGLKIELGTGLGETQKQALTFLLKQLLASLNCNLFFTIQIARTVPVRYGSKIVDEEDKK